MIILAVPSEFFRKTAKIIKNYFSNQIVVSVAKGIEHDTGKRMSQIIEDELGKKTKIAVLSGPNHAEEVSMKMPTASVVASKEKQTGKIVADCLATPYFKLY